MKIRRLNEVNENTSENKTIEDFKNEFDSSTTTKGKADVIREAIKKFIDRNSDNAEALCNFDDEFLNNWIRAMKWSELERKDNPLVKVLNYGSSQTPVILKNIETFSKFYNVYAKELLDSDCLLDDSGILGTVYRKILLGPDPYNWSTDELLTVCKEFVEILDASEDGLIDGDDENILRIFINSDGPISIEDKLNSPAIIHKKFTKYKEDSNNFKEPPKNKISELIKDLRNLSDEDRNYLINTLTSKSFRSKTSGKAG